MAGPAVSGASPADDQALRMLLERAGRGDQEATEHLVAHLHDGIYRLALAVTNEPADAEEVVQETFLSIFRGQAHFAGRSAVTTWAHRIALNAALTRVRTRQRRPWDAVHAYGSYWDQERPPAGSSAESADASVALGGMSMGTVATWASPPDRGALSHEMRAHIDRAVRALPERYRLVFILRDVEGHSNEVVAEMLGLTVPTVKARLLRARASMRHVLGPYLNGHKEPGGG